MKKRSLQIVNEHFVCIFNRLRQIKNNFEIVSINNIGTS